MPAPAAPTSEIVSQWYALSQGEVPRVQDPFFRFVALWIAFNAYYDAAYTFGGDDLDRVLMFASESAVRELHSRLLAHDAGYIRHVASLQSRGVTTTRGSVQRVDDRRSCGSLVRCLYTIRCNLFHGDKSPSNARDRDVVEAALYILSRLFPPALERAHQLR